MAPVLAQVRSDAIGARLFGQLGGPYGVGKAATSGISDGCHMIDIHAQSKGEYARVHDIVSFSAVDSVAWRSVALLPARRRTRAF